LTWFDGFGWFPDANQPLGSGFFIQPAGTAGNQIVTFVGEVQTGSSTNVISGALSLLGSTIPVAGPQPGGAVGHEGDTVFTWDVAGNSWVATSYFGGYGWFDGTAETNGPSLKVAEGMFYQNTGGTLDWIQTLNP
jgi:hypothetical protein